MTKHNAAAQAVEGDGLTPVPFSMFDMCLLAALGYGEEALTNYGGRHVQDQ